jgi:hypothetical protein
MVRNLPVLPIQNSRAARAFDRKETPSVAASASEWTRDLHSLALAATKVQLLSRDNSVETADER